eukprot:scaffold166461_cov43-Prasinocladus_malaysianus.AAC.3
MAVRLHDCFDSVWGATGAHQHVTLAALAAAAGAQGVRAEVCLAGRAIRPPAATVAGTSKASADPPGTHDGRLRQLRGHSGAQVGNTAANP